MTSDMALPPLADVIRRHELAPRKSLGQHFLLDPGVTDRIAASAGDLSAATVIEIGPGPGGLTRSLLNAGAAHVVAIEKDRRCVGALQELVAAAQGRLTIEEADALRADEIALAPEPRKIIANLPYNIATELLLKWLQEPTRFECMVLMFQKEVARRIAASPGGREFGRLSVKAQWLCQCELLFDLRPGAFTPPPKVSSTVLRLTPYKKPLFDADVQALEAVTAAGFGQRRKMLRSALKRLGIPPESILEPAGIDPTRRAETLEIEEWCTLARAYSAQILG